MRLRLRLRHAWLELVCVCSIPLTVLEWEEWGNPNMPDFFEYMMQYSPLDNVSEQDYPNLLITAGFHDPRVAYWEPAKWAAKLRAKKSSKDFRRGAFR